MTFRELWEYQQFRDKQWRIRAKSMAIWIAAAHAGDDLTDGDPEFTRLIESVD